MLGRASLLQAVMLATLVAYYRNPTFAGWLDQLAQFKQRHDLGFIVGAGILAGALFPELFLIFFFQKGKPNRQNFRNLAFTVPIWGSMARWSISCIAARLIWFGDVVSAPVVFAKICVDQFGYNHFLRHRSRC